MTPDLFNRLIDRLRRQPRESEWLEFKQNNSNPEEIGEYISALSNSAAIDKRPKAYLLWGIEDNSHAIVGTTFDPHSCRVGNCDLEPWLTQLLSPRITFNFFSGKIENKSVVVLEIDPARSSPTQFKNVEFIRIASTKRKLKDVPEKARLLWKSFDSTPDDQGIAKESATDNEVLELINYQAFYDLMSLPTPRDTSEVLLRLQQEKMINPSEAGGWDITVTGALLFAWELSNFSSLQRKAVRVIKYKSVDRITTDKETVGTLGYAAGFQALISHVNSLVPSNEIIGSALRKTVPMFPELAVRELIANALIHQDLSTRGSGPMIEIFSNRMEITNPGIPLIDIVRLVDSPPQSRNEYIAYLMRRLGICEERGSGWDKIVHETENYQLPAPLVEITQNNTRIVIFAHKLLSKMDRDERNKASYLHACLKHVNREFLTNASLRKRFGVEEKNKATVSRYIKEAVEAQLIKPYDESAARNQMRYVPFWA